MRLYGANSIKLIPSLNYGLRDQLFLSYNPLPAGFHLNRTAAALITLSATAPFLNNTNTGLNIPPSDPPAGPEASARSNCQNPPGTGRRFFPGCGQASYCRPRGAGSADSGCSTGDCPPEAARFRIRPGRRQAGYPRDRCRGAGPDVHEHRRDRPGGHPRRPLHQARVVSARKQ